VKEAGMSKAETSESRVENAGMAEAEPTEAGVEENAVEPAVKAPPNPMETPIGHPHPHG
jgi:hypothetical protein